MRFVFILITALLTFSGQIYAGETLKASYDNFVTMADIHFDPFQACDREKPCRLIETLRKSPVSSWDTIFNELDKTSPRYHHDVDYALLTSSLHAAGQTAIREHAKFAIFLGDALGHNYWTLYKRYSSNKSAASYQQFVEKTLQFMTSLIAKEFRPLNVYMVLGNNDSYYGDYYTTQSNDFFSDSAAAFSKLINPAELRNSIQHQFSNKGYYAITLPELSGLKLIVLNTNLFSTKAKGKNVNKAAEEELKWLHQQLSSASAQHQKVYIAMHIPPGVDLYASLRTKLFRLLQLWQPDFDKKFEMELSEHKTIIRAILTGHLHSDWLHIKKIEDAQIPLVGVPAVSPKFGNLPSFKVFYFSPQTFELQNYQVYSYEFTRSGDWRMQFDFNQMHHQHCEECAVIESK
jgi:sphingomyelin phosphodiesterase acid-like 3